MTTKDSSAIRVQVPGVPYRNKPASWAHNIFEKMRGGVALLDLGIDYDGA